MVDPGADQEAIRNAERMKFFTDAVVAIAMTLLILPLLESVSEAASKDLTTAEFFDEHGGQLFAFVLSFAIIAGFWVSHERLFANVGHWTGRLMVLNLAWMLTIVFLPIATAMVGTMETDRPQILVYIGTMLVSSVLMGAMNVVIRNDPSIWEEDVQPGVGGLAAQISLIILYALALGIALGAPDANYLALFVLLLSGPLQALIQRRLTPRTP